MGRSTWNTVDNTAWSLPARGGRCALSGGPLALWQAALTDQSRPIRSQPAVPVTRMLPLPLGAGLAPGSAC
jgi:hypothetical protein